MNSFFKSATRVIGEDDVQNFIRDLVHNKFRWKERNWYLNSSTDGINVYSDLRNSLNSDDQYVSKAEVKKLIS